MTSVLRAGFTLRAAIHRPCRRLVHSTPASFAKKKAGASDAFDDDLFAEESDGDLFADENTQPAKPAAAPTPSPTKVKKELPRMPPAVRQAKYKSLLEFALPRISATGAARRKLLKHPPYLRSTAFSQLVQLAASPVQLEQVAELLPDWTSKYGQKFEHHVVEEFVRRCDTLGCPQLAFKVFGHLPRYNLTLSPAATHRLMHSLYQNKMFADVLTVAAFYPSHSLGPVEEDIVACSILAAASLKTGHKVIAVELLSKIRLMLGAKRQEPVEKRLQWKDKATLQDSWVKQYLRRVDLMMENDGSSQGWLRKWRQRSIPKPVTTTA